jgi:hypothetical protein
MQSYDKCYTSNKVNKIVNTRRNNNKKIYYRMGHIDEDDVSQSSSLEGESNLP